MPRIGPATTSCTGSASRRPSALGLPSRNLPRSGANGFAGHAAVWAGGFREAIATRTATARRRRGRTRARACGSGAEAGSRPWSCLVDRDVVAPNRLGPEDRQVASPGQDLATGPALRGHARSARSLTDTTSLVTARPLFAGIDLDEPAQFVIGGHDIRRSSYVEAARALHQRSNVFGTALLEKCQPDLESWDKNVRPGTILGSGSTISKMADWPEAITVARPRQASLRIQGDLRDFQSRHKLDQVTVINVSSTEAPFLTDERHASLASFEPLLDSTQTDMPASSVYAWAALDLGLPFVNFTPSLGPRSPRRSSWRRHGKPLSAARTARPARP